MSQIIPKNSIINKSIKKLDYFDSFETVIPKQENYSIDYLTAKLFTSTPNWVIKLLSLRDLIVEPFDLKTGKDKTINKIDKNIIYDIGSKALFFTVLTKNENEIVLSEDDKHLYFRTSVLKEDFEDKLKIHLTTIVIYHNFFGKFYFFFVKPFHRIIMRAMLNLLKKSGIEK